MQDTSNDYMLAAMLVSVPVAQESPPDSLPGRAGWAFHLWQPTVSRRRAGIGAAAELLAPHRPPARPAAYCRRQRTEAMGMAMSLIMGPVTIPMPTQTSELLL